MTASGPSHPLVVVHLSRPDELMRTHEAAAIERLARTVASLTRGEYGGLRAAGRDEAPPVPAYVVPDDVLLADAARDLGIARPEDLYGGVVPHPFLRTKIVVHPLVEDAALRPEGWPAEFPERVARVVLPGFSVFSAEDARRAFDALRLLAPVRLKPPQSAAGRGQRVVDDAGELEAFVDALGIGPLREHGLVLETHLDQVQTWSVGQVRAAGTTVSYYGRQRTTRDNHGGICYGGSDLTVVRGGWDALDGCPLTDELRRAVGQARQYDDVLMTWPGVLASRRNYDVAQGVDGRGERRSGILEHSCRAGGASAAEIAAIRVFCTEPARTVVRASTFEVYGHDAEPPAGASIIFRGHDPNLGPFLQYTTVSEGDG